MSRSYKTIVSLTVSLCTFPCAPACPANARTTPTSASTPQTKPPGSTPSTSLANVAEQIAGVITPCGLFLAGSKHNVHVLTLLPGKWVEFVPPDRPKYWIVDDILVESTFASESDMSLPAGRFRDLDLLRRHRRWETEWTAKQNGWPKLNPVELRVGKASQHHGPYSIWTYAVRKPLVVLGHRVARVSYLTVFLEDGVLLVLSVPLRQTDSADKAHALLEKAVDGIERHMSQADLVNMTMLIRHIASGAKTCAEFIDRMDQKIGQK